MIIRARLIVIALEINTLSYDSSKYIYIFSTNVTSNFELMNSKNALNFIQLFF